MFDFKLENISQIEIRREDLEKFLFVFNYKIRELTTQVNPRQQEFHFVQQQSKQVRLFVFVDENDLFVLWVFLRFRPDERRIEEIQSTK